jgi:hypothetical protein
VGKPELRRDIEHLAGDLVHRGASTRSERLAAEYLRGRFLEVTPDVELDDFYAIEGPWLLFASYYLEFVVVSILVMWIPWAAFAYGATVFILYLAETTGYQLLGALLPQFETQNVVARLLAPRPRRLFILTAHYDSPKETPLIEPGIQGWLWAGHLVLVICMVLVLVSCATEAANVFPDSLAKLDDAVRWTAAGVLVLGAIIVGSCGLPGDYARGAVNNASGVAVLVELAGRFAREPIEDADVWFVATGSKESWMCGMRRFLRTHALDKDTTYFLNIDEVGLGSLRYLTSEGMLSSFSADREMVEVAKSLAVSSGAQPRRWRGLPTDALLPLVRGYKALGITAVGGRTDFEGETDRPGAVDYNTVAQAADFAEGIVRGVNSGSRV